MIAILLSTYNGASFLEEQLRSFLDQTYTNWRLFWRDDGSTDDTIAIMEAFSKRTGRCVRVVEPAVRLGATASFFSLLQTINQLLGPDDMVAFSDQDDVWLSDKLERGVSALKNIDQSKPCIYFARQIIVDEKNNKIRTSQRIKSIPQFPQSVVQNIATGCTIIINRSAVSLVAGSNTPENSFHDWWCYIIISAARGILVYDDHCVIRYRQHGKNATGYPLTWGARSYRAATRGRRAFMRTIVEHLQAIENNERIGGSSRDIAKSILEIYKSNFIIALYRLAKIGIKRGAIVETFVLYIWFAIDVVELRRRKMRSTALPPR